MNYSKLESRQRWLGKVNAYLPPLHNLPPKVLRLVLKGFDKSLGLSKTAMKSVTEHQIPSKIDSGLISARAYYPDTEANSVLVYFHGGGCVIGDLDTHDSFCRLLAHHGKQIVIAIDYRLAPEHKYPQPVFDAIDAWNWVIDNQRALNIEGKYIGVGGDSAGGYYAALIGLEKEQQKLPVKVTQAPAFQFLIYPLTDQRGDTESYHKYNRGLLLTTPMVEYFKNHYLNSEQEAELPLVSPILSEYLEQSPRTYLLTTEFDPLADSGKEYVKKLQENGVDVDHKHLPDCMHQFISVTKISKRAKQACMEICKDLADFTSQQI